MLDAQQKRTLYEQQANPYKAVSGDVDTHTDTHATQHNNAASLSQTAKILQIIDTIAHCLWGGLLA